jgi:hypothetical protein
LKSAAVSGLLDAAADACNEAEAPEVDAEARELVTSAFRARGSIDEMAVRLDLAGARPLLDELVDTDWLPAGHKRDPRPDAEAARPATEPDASAAGYPWTHHTR